MRVLPGPEAIQGSLVDLPGSFFDTSRVEVEKEVVLDNPVYPTSPSWKTSASTLCREYYVYASLVVDDPIYPTPPSWETYASTLCKDCYTYASLSWARALPTRVASLAAAHIGGLTVGWPLATSCCMRHLELRVDHMLKRKRNQQAH
ncbi:hypothetical protein L7F22_041318 [Adiantum nelumboides]|nr:hypothetical protein [Adiantum nelumboides]